MKTILDFEFARLSEIAEAIREHSNHRFPDGEDDGACWMDAEHTRVRVDCGYDFHFARLEEVRPGHFAWVV